MVLDKKKFLFFSKSRVNPVFGYKKRYRKGENLRIYFKEGKNLCSFGGRVTLYHRDRIRNVCTLRLCKRYRGISLERTFPLNAPFIRKIEIIQ